MYEVVNNDKGNHFYLTSDGYNSVINGVKEAKCESKIEKFHYRQLKHNHI